MALTEQTQRTVYFLGAGASAAVSRHVVVTVNLLQHALSPTHDGHPQDLKIARELVGFLSSEENTPRIDDVLSVLDLALSDELALSNEWPPSRLSDVRLALNRLIYNCIQSTIHKNEAPVSPLRSLVTHCRDESGSVIVTLNWDCLVERRLVQVFGRAEGVIDYGIPCITHRGDPFPVHDDAVLVLKPHGSLSWGHCQLCGALLADLTTPYDFAESRHCPQCSNPALRSVLVPPARSNRPRPWFLGAVWSRAESAIYDSDRMVIIGYSFPPEDVDVRVSLIRALARRKQRPKAPPLSIEVVTLRNPARGQDELDLQKRYLSMIGGNLSSANLTFYSEGFSRWAEERLP